MRLEVSSRNQVESEYHNTSHCFTLLHITKFNLILSSMISLMLIQEQAIHTQFKVHHKHLSVWHHSKSCCSVHCLHCLLMYDFRVMAELGRGLAKQCQNEWCMRKRHKYTLFQMDVLMTTNVAQLRCSAWPTIHQCQFQTGHAVWIRVHFVIWCGSFICLLFHPCAVFI